MILILAFELLPDGIEEYKAERADAVNPHACGTFGTSAAEIVYYLPPNI
ncbi:MAG: hypothetical protein WCO94_17325 [Verrucomicrobiota bacterium]